MASPKLDYCFALWMDGQLMHGALVTPEQVVAEWAVSRATAFRWLTAYREAQRWAARKQGRAA